MQYWRTYAHITEDAVANIAVYEPNGAFTIAMDDAHRLYGDRAFAVDVTQIPVAIGDSYSAGRFYRSGEQIKPLATDEEEIDGLNNSMGTVTSEIADLQLAIVEVYEMLGD